MKFYKAVDDLRVDVNEIQCDIMTSPVIQEELFLPNMLVAFTKTRAEFYMPTNWDPQSEPAKSDCIVTINLFCPRYLFIGVCFCS